MRLAVLILLTTLTGADAQPLKVKTVDEDYSPDAAKQFADGMIGLRQGNLSHALSGFEQSLKSEPHAATAYNVAIVWSRLEDPETTASYLTEYLRLAPKAADRKDVEAWIKTLKTANPTVTIGGSTTARYAKEVDAIILVDGKLIGASPVSLQIAPGLHFAERITAHTYEGRTYEARAGQRPYWVLPAGDNHEGSVVITTSASLFATQYESMYGWREGEQQLQTGRLIKLTAGSYKTDARGQLCAPIEFAVKSGDVITYVYLDGKPRQQGKKCLDIVRTTTQYLRRPQ